MTQCNYSVKYEVMGEQAPKKRGRGRPRLEATEGREDIKRAALSAFAKHGFRGTSIDQIAVRAGVAKRLIHYHFGSKDALWQQAVSEAYEEFRQEALGFAAQVQRGETRDLAKVVARQIVQFAAQRVELIQISIDETRQGGERAEWLSETYLVPLQQIMTMQLALLLGDEQRAKAAAAHMVPAIFGAIVFPFVDADVVQLAHDKDVFEDTYIDEHARYIATLLETTLSSISLDGTHRGTGPSES